MTTLVMVAVMATAGSAGADGGELFLGAGGGVEVSRLAYLRAGLEQGSGYETPWPVGPELALEARYGLSDRWQLGVELEWAWLRSARYEHVMIDGREGRLYVRYRQVTLPLTLSYSWSRGYDWSVRLAAKAGATWTRWEDLGMVDPTRNDAAGKLVQYPITLRTEGGVGGYGALGVYADWRPFDSLGLSVGPVVAMSQSRLGGGSGWNLQLALALAPHVVRGIGPGW